MTCFPYLRNLHNLFHKADTHTAPNYHNDVLTITYQPGSSTHEKKKEKNRSGNEVEKRAIPLREQYSLTFLQGNKENEIV